MVIKLFLKVKALPLERKGVINRQKNGQEIKKEKYANEKNHDSLKKMVRKGLIYLEIH